MRNIAAISRYVNKTPDLIGANARLLQLRQQFTGENHAASAFQKKSCFENCSSVHVITDVSGFANPETRSPQRIVTPRNGGIGKNPVSENHRQTDGWLAPICQLTVEPATANDAQAVPKQQTISIPIDILTALLRAEMAVIGRIWLLGRHLDQNGSGWISVETLRQKLTNKTSDLRICGWRRLRQLLHAGKGILWKRDDHGRLWLFGLVRVAVNLELARFSCDAIALPLESLIGSVATVKATFLAAFHAGRESIPISRAALREVTGVPERTQQEYDRQTDTKTNLNVSLCGRFSAETQKDHTFKHGGAAFTFTDKHGKHGAAGTKYHARQLPNSYQNSLETVNFGRKRKLNQQLKQQTDLVTIVARGNGQQLTVSSEQKFVRRYFDDGKLAAQSLGREQTTILQASQGVWHELKRGSEKSC